MTSKTQHSTFNVQWSPNSRPTFDDRDQHSSIFHMENEIIPTLAKPCSVLNSYCHHDWWTSIHLCMSCRIAISRCPSGWHWALYHDVSLTHSWWPQKLNCWRPFCKSGQSCTTFPVNIKCRTAEEAKHVLNILGPLADECGAAGPAEVISLLSNNGDWVAVCSLMQAQSQTFWVVSYGQRVGIFINRCFFSTA